MSHKTTSDRDGGDLVRRTLPSLPSPTPAHDMITTIANHTGFHDPVTYLARPLRCLLPIAQRIGAHVVAAAASKVCLHGITCVALGSGIILIYHRLQSLEARMEDLLGSN